MSPHSGPEDQGPSTPNLEASSGAATTPTPSAVARKPSAFQGYLANVHLLLVGVLLVLTVGLGALGFSLRPGTDEPPSVFSPRIQLYVFQRTSSASPSIWPTQVSVDETLLQKTSSVVELQLDLFDSFLRSGEVYWHLLTSTSGSQPYACPDPYHYLGTTYSNPLVVQNGSLTVMGHGATQAVIANLVGRQVSTASDILGLQGQSAGNVPPNTIEPLGLINLCWSRDAPLAFDGEYASASIPTVSPYFAGGPNFAFHLATSLYFENPGENVRPIAAEYSLQAGSLPTSTDPYGWHWSSNPTGQIQLTALSIPQSQHETYLGFVSGVMFGVAGGAFVALLQELLTPLRRKRARRHGGESSSSYQHEGQTEKGPTRPVQHSEFEDLNSVAAGTSRSRITGTAIRLSIAILALAVIGGSIAFAVTYTDNTSAPSTLPKGDVPPQSTVSVIDDCASSGRIEPSSITLLCGDGGATASSLSWSQWTSKQAIGRGVVNILSCVPNCVNGSESAYGVRLTLSEPVRARSGALYFTRITLSYLGSSPPTGPRSAVYKDCYDTPPAPFLPKCPANEQGAA
jgi:hypothetical protein